MSGNGYGSLFSFSGRYSMCGGMTSGQANLNTESVVSYKRNIQTVLCDNTTQGLVSVDVHCKKATSFLFLWLQSACTVSPGRDIRRNFTTHLVSEMSAYEIQYWIQPFCGRAETTLPFFHVPFPLHFCILSVWSVAFLLLPSCLSCSQKPPLLFPVWRTRFLYWHAKTLPLCP